MIKAVLGQGYCTPLKMVTRMKQWWNDQQQRKKKIGTEEKPAPVPHYPL
jgi:hypothetical protein